MHAGKMIRFCTLLSEVLLGINRNHLKPNASSLISFVEYETACLSSSLALIPFSGLL